MKKTILLLLLLPIVLPALSQTDTTNKKRTGKTRNMDIEFAIGYSFSLGDYSKFDKNNSKSGYAANGWLAQLTFDWLGKRDIGLGFQYTYQRNPLLDTASKVNPNYTDTSYRLGPGAWANHYLMAGPVYHHYFKKISVDIKVLLGVMFGVSSNFSVEDPAALETKFGTGSGLAYQFSGGVGYKISPHFAINIQGSFLGANPSINKQYYVATLEPRVDEYGNTYYVRVYTGSEITIKKVVSTINIGLGVIFKL